MGKEINVKVNKNRLSLEQNDKRPNKNIDSSYLYKQKDEKPVVRIEVTSRTILLVAVVILAVTALISFGGKILEFIVILFISLILASAFLPIVRWLMSKKISKGLAIAIVYTVFILLMLIITALVVIPFLRELQNLILNFPEISSSILDAIAKIKIPFVNIDKELVKEQVSSYLNKISTDILPLLTKGINSVWQTLSTLASLFSVFFSVITVIFLSVYIISDHDYLIDNFLNKVVVPDKRDIFRKLINDVEYKLGSWLLGQALLSLIIGVMTWIVLTILGMPFALPLAVFAGIMEMIPSLGPLFSLIPAIFIALFDNGLLYAMLILAAYLVIQQIENNIVVPKVMGNAVGLRPIYIFVGLLLGYSLGGVLGALLTVPILGITKICIDFYFELQRLKAKEI